MLKTGKTTGMEDGDGSIDSGPGMSNAKVRTESLLITGGTVPRAVRIVMVVGDNTTC